MRALRRLSLPTLLLLASAFPAAGQDVADPVDPIEDKALRDEAQARFEEALETFRQAFATAVEQAAGGGEGRVRNLARAEVLLEKVSSLTERTSRHAETEKFLAGYGGEALGPVLRARVEWERARELLAEGDREGAGRLLMDLGIVRHWWVIGPFDNERGRGFKTEFPPQKGVDLDEKTQGKEREVAWRQLPVDDPTGYVDLDALLRPNDQACAYAVAFVRSASEQDASIRLGSDEAVRAWWNGGDVLSRDVRRTLAFDQDVVGVHLAAGWNVLLVKVHDQTGAWGFRVRLTAPDGSAVAGVEVADTPEEAREALGQKAKPAPFAGEVAGGARQFYDAAVKAGGPQTPRDLFHLGYLHARRSFDSVKDRTAENLLKKAAEAQPENAIYRFHYAEAAAPPAELAVEKEENRQRIGREKALEVDPGYAVAYRALASYYTDSLTSLARAEELLRKALEVNPDYVEARLELARVLEMRGLPAAAELERAKALDAAGAKSLEVAARVRAQQLERKGLGKEATDAWKEVLRLDARGNDVRRKVAELAAKALDRDAALAVLDELAAWNPYDTSALLRKSEIQEGALDMPGAEATLGRALAVAPEDDGLLQALARVQAKDGRPADAITTFRRALVVNPKLQGVERYLEYLDPDAAPYEDDYRIEVADLVKKAEGWQNEENDGWLVLLDQVVTKVNRDGTSSNYMHFAAKILTQAGLENFDRYFAQSRGGESFKWKLARVLKPDGSTVEAKTQQHQGWRFADFPPLQPGDVIDVEYRRDDRQQSVFGDYFGEVYYFADSVPALHISATLVTPADRTFHFHQRKLDGEPAVALRDDGKTRVYTWTRTDVAKVRAEDMMPGPRELYPQVQVTTYASWDEFAHWWWNMIRDQQIASPAIKEKVAELVAGKDARMDKVRAIYEFVTGDITYQAVPFGPHGYQPYTTTAIFEKREGDCKDKALLFNTMLHEVGIDAFPVLIYGANATRDEEDLTLAMVGHFNHCISYVPDADGKGTPMWFDGTAEYGSAMLPPGMDIGAKVVVVRPEGAEIMQIPLNTPEQIGIAQKWDVEIADDGSAKVTASFEFRGDMAIAIRQGFSVEGQRALRLQAMFSRAFGKITLAEHEFDDLRDRGSPVTGFRATMQVPGFAKAEGDTVTLPTAFLQFVGDLAELAKRPEREHDLVMPNPMAFRIEATYHLPAGWTVVAPPEDATIDLPAVSVMSKATQEGGTLTLVREVQLKGGRVKPSEYAAFRDAVNRASAAMSQTWKVKKGDAAPVK